MTTVWHGARSRLMLAALGVGCAGGERAPAPAPTATTTASAGIALSAPAGSTSAPAPPSSAAEQDAIPDRHGAAGTTRGSIACGKARCRADREVCTLQSEPLQWACLPAPAEAESFYACDDASDCAAPLTCCRSFASAAAVYACAKPDEDCAALACSEPDGKQCPQGQSCRDDHCRLDSRATCGGEKLCPKEAPYCAWSSAPACVDEGTAESSADALQGDNPSISGIYACTKPSDCGTQQCCTSMTLAEKLTNCFHRCDAANSMLLCARDADCRERAQAWCGDNAACRKAVRCVRPTSDTPGATPAWMKVCQQRDY